MKKPDICQICLRLDRKLKVVDQELCDLHDELCDYVLDPLNYQYCVECAYLLKKTYNFQVRCKNAIVVFKKWRITKTAERKPANLLYTLLPRTSLGLWTPDNNKIHTFTYEDQEPEESNDSAFSNNEIKTECEDDSARLYSQNPHSFHPQVLNTFEEVTVNDGNFNNDEQLDDNDRLLDDDDVKEEEYLNIFFVSGDNDEDVNTSHDKSSDSVANDHCYTKEIEEQNDTPKSKSRTELANISLTDDDFICDDDTEVISDMGDSISENDDSDTPVIFDTDDSDNISDDDDDDKERTRKNKTKKKIIEKNGTKIKKITKNKTNVKSDNKNKTSDSNKVANFELMNITINEDNDKIKLKKLQFSKERLIAELEKKFAAVGEIKTRDGATIDNQFVLTCLNEKVNESTLRLLWNSIRGRHHANIKPRALNIFKTIQNKYKNDHQFESVFDIEYLNTEEKVRAEFERRKTYECYTKAQYKCEICYQGFKHEKLLEYHSKYHEENSESVVCTVCRVQCRRANMYSHMASCHEAVYKCKRCPLVTHHRTSMINHYEQHQGKKYICELCGTSYKSRSAYMTHRGLAHRSVGQHICTLCGRSLYSALALKVHKTRMHTGHTPTGREVKCLKCDLTFASQEVYLRHVRNAHFGLLPDGTRAPRLITRVRKPNKYMMTCRVAPSGEVPICKQLFNHNFILQVYPTLKCDTVGTGYGWLISHFRLKHPTVDMSVVYADTRKHLCDVCGKGFSNSYTLRYHMNKHTGSRPYVCGTCSKRFHSYVLLQNHRLIHLPPTKSCPHCGKMFRTSTHLSVHLRSHIRDRCYKCNICGKDFLHGSTLNAHVRGVHYHMRRVKKKGVTESGAKKEASYSEENSD